MKKALRGDANTARWLYKGGPTNTHTNTHTHTHTERDRGDYNTLRRSFASVQCNISTQKYTCPTLSIFTLRANA